MFDIIENNHLIINLLIVLLILFQSIIRTYGKLQEMREKSFKLSAHCNAAKVSVYLYFAVVSKSKPVDHSFPVAIRTCGVSVLDPV